jgi:hypothetical protein
MISRVLTVGFMLLSVTLVCAPASAGPHPCPELASAPADEVTELARGVASVFGGKAKKVDQNKQPKEQSEPVVGSLQGADELVNVVAAR